MEAKYLREKNKTSDDHKNKSMGYKDITVSVPTKVPRNDFVLNARVNPRVEIGLK